MSPEPDEVSAAQEAAPIDEPVRVLVPSQLGNLGVEFRHTAISRIVFAPTGKEKKLFFPLSDYEDSDFLDEVFGRISEFFAGARKLLELEYDLAPSGLDSFARRVLKEVSRTPYGKTRTYKDVAEAAGRPEAYRQVLSIVEKNPLPILIACHRIVPTKSGIGNYVGGVARKRWLLRMERDTIAAAAAG
ncbi:MAG: methylated-DNA--[protein]-cysteine S-methyltransferase [Holophagales bacterium]|nr:methylated-DNA--[protein]-cysteine S-methyltransferase [Holophagales bacterium]